MCQEPASHWSFEDRYLIKAGVAMQRREWDGQEGIYHGPELLEIASLQAAYERPLLYQSLLNSHKDLIFTEEKTIPKQCWKGGFLGSR